MKFIYIENYLKISRNNKLDFVVLMNGFKNFKVVHQKIILDDNSILLEFNEESDMLFAKKIFEKFFADIVVPSFKVNILFVEKIVQDNNELILAFDNGSSKKIAL